MSHEYLIALIDKKHGHLYSYTAETQRLEPFEEISDDVPRPAKGASWKGLADDKVARHIEVHIHDHWKHILERIESVLRLKPDKSLLLGGPEEDVQAFLAITPHTLQERIIGTIHPSHYAGLNQLKDKIQAAIREVENEAVQSLIQEITQQAHPAGRGLIGQEAVCEALNLAQIEKIIIDRHGDYPGYVCPTGEALSTLQPTCPHCLAPMVSRDNLFQDIEQLAKTTNASLIELPSGVNLPPEADGLIGLKRYVD